MTKFDTGHIDLLVEKYTKKYVSADHDICRSYKYALFGGGKRMRPLLMLNMASALGQVDENIERLVVAMECIHTYSLVHDDLPAMDNDDLRRGKPTVHKIFGEALAILCGDGLLTMATQIVAAGQNSQEYIKAIELLFDSAQNMVHGQADDLKANIFIDESRYFEIVAEKTGGILCDCLYIPAVYFKRTKTLDKIKEIGEKIGRLYQVTDDILDGKKDETSILNFMDLPEAKAFLKRSTEEVEKQIVEYEQLENVNLQYLKDFVEFNITRKM